MSSPLPPSPGTGPSSARELVVEVADRLGASVVAVVGGTVAVLLVAVAVVVAWRRDEPPPPEISIPYAAADDRSEAPEGGSTTTVPAEVTVHVAGAVQRPGVYVLPEPARVGDLLAAAGGPLPDADLDRLNLAAPAADGSRLFVPLRGQPEVPAVLGPDGGVPLAGTSGDGADAKVDVNRADATALEALPGVGPATASAIVAHREEHGPFRRVDDLLEVRGIGEAKLEAIRDLVVVGG
ncbi:ComEA family DNA-binding protein [Actinomarinicola tropica]|uniref:ComEA family DNA-binding protein n=1 Tax=Actinomarinicola tropica TaxID=2789776 RepID=A0A5Q2RNK9_9ACTN|nr:ComEA family DNA-binding protein [Actinomarinicola tropica]QGG95677.1 ComEA family DNA-binding protein [Actinomarinicola tropica]